ncbi:hypothetical protein HpCHC93_14970 [Helicobacter pylori]|uniref:hypothetical protein n=1 Tax=Helicobacter pylori TaxID=210 RepID=UPI000EAF686C|nr:hypothetical protein [Helicobacter pylori]BDO44982.1 hypothetical protein VN1291_10830 [Helicobacter pylori]BDO45480.1 hypothetical protein VN1291_15810 [Helicobacter pylori]BDO46590.1 hypothetical protein CHC155_10830 [Helicobacter pylori]BDO47069.1 hypothetical protein CHC155_15620 [Helicobacter pylori]GHP38364.1 hypothetical protein VN0219_15260 [Helicobacter pylori]
MDLQQIDELEKKFEQQEEQTNEQESHLKQEISIKEIKTPKKRGRKKYVLDEDKKKSFNIAFSPSVIKELDEFLLEFGSFKETRSTFIEEALIRHLKHRKNTQEQKLLKQLERLQKKDTNENNELE